MKSGFDINRIDGDGYLVIPLSMSRLATGQNPQWCYDLLGQFESKLGKFGSDVIFLYTNGLYFNSTDISFENRKRTNQQILNHNAQLRALVEKNKEFIPGAVHYLPVDYVILNSSKFHEFFSVLKKAEQEDSQFREMLIKDSDGREYNEANVNFLLEEIAIAHIIREKLVEFPRTLVRSDTWRLIAYPGLHLQGDRYQWKKKLLPQGKTDNPYAGAQYDLDQNKLFLFDEAES